MIGTKVPSFDAGEVPRRSAPSLSDITNTNCYAPEHTMTNERPIAPSPQFCLVVGALLGFGG